MARDNITLGPTPFDEECAQVGQNDYGEKSRKECWAYKRQLERAFPDAPAGAYLAVKSFPHDFGVYREVVCAFDDNDQASIDYAYNMENKSPRNWDAEARKELGLAVVE